MNVDTAKTTEAFGKLSPWQAVLLIALVCLGMVAGAGYIVHVGMTRVHVDLIELQHAVERLGDDMKRSNEAAEERSDRYFETQTRIIAVLERMVAMQAATCLAQANGSEEDRNRCEAVMVQP